MATIAVCRTDEVPADSALCKRLPGGLQVAVARLAGGDSGYVAFENRCPHAQGPIGEGKLSGGAIVCPWHFFRFDLATGKPPGMDSIMQLRRFPISIGGGEIRIEV
jgi:nitrite reductase/ring-hydroxylating ferredoxin subunit